MNKKFVICFTLAAIFAGTAMASQAATSSHEKPRCKPGQVAKQDPHTGDWACKPLLMPAKPSAQPTSSSSSMPTPMVPTKQKTSLPTRAFPDLTIIEVIKMPGFDNKFQVKVQNIGNATASGAVLQGEDTTGLGGGGTMPIPTLTPNKYSAMIFQVPSANIDHGDRIKFFADAYKKVYESNENNNVRYFNVP